MGSPVSGDPLRYLFGGVVPVWDGTRRLVLCNRRDSFCFTRLPWIL
jgi:hypothetical protein